jgi:hypothetical protein
MSGQLPVRLWLRYQTLERMQQMNERSEDEHQTRIHLDDVISAASEGVLRALEARQRGPQPGEGFFVELHVRCGIPTYLPLPSVNTTASDHSSGSRSS